MDVEHLVGAFVVEILLRRVWPFIGFCDSRETPSGEIRLYIDADRAIDGRSGVDSDDAGWVTAALGLNRSTVTEAVVDAEGNLRVATADGESLAPSGAPSLTTAGSPW